MENAYRASAKSKKTRGLARPYKKLICYECDNDNDGDDAEMYKWLK